MKGFPISIQIGGIFFATVAVSIIFALIYYKLSNLTFINALYKSFSIQTIGGNQIEPKNNAEKIAISIQSFIAFMIISGLIVISVNFGK